VIKEEVPAKNRRVAWSYQMTDRLIFTVTFFSALGSGLVAGVFFAFSVFVMTALGRLPAAGGISAMQSINVAVLNPWFFLAFLGTAAASVLLVVAAVFRWGEPGSSYLLFGSVLYLVGGLLVTIAFNVPLNDALAGIEPDNAEGASLWTHYLSDWTFWNHVRMAASLLAAASYTTALCYQAHGPGAA
jgi:uncharacterized membrane protein